MSFIYLAEKCLGFLLNVCAVPELKQSMHWSHRGATKRIFNNEMCEALERKRFIFIVRQKPVLEKIWEWHSVGNSGGHSDGLNPGQVDTKAYVPERFSYWRARDFVQNLFREQHPAYLSQGRQRIFSAHTSTA